tara:strand:- start:341 stop:814 length:474 start_codon:yes stop_codon:yes gene_type:complete
MSHASNIPELKYRWGEEAAQAAADNGCPVQRVIETFKGSGRSHFSVMCDNRAWQVLYVWCKPAPDALSDIECGTFKRKSEAGMALSSFPFERELRYEALKYQCSVRDAKVVRIGWSVKMQQWAILKFRCGEDGPDGAPRNAGCQFSGVTKYCRFLRE